MKTIPEIERFFIEGHYGTGFLLDQDFEQFQSGMINLLLKTTGDNLDATQLSSTAAGRIAIAGTCVMAATLSEDKNVDQKIRMLTSRTVDALNQRSIDEINLNTSPEVTLLDVGNNDSPTPLLSLLSDRFEQNMADSDVAIQLNPTPVTVENRRHFESAVNLLYKNIPNLAADVLPMISAVLPISSVESGFVSPTPLLVYIDPAHFSTPLELADALLHEALHQKLLTIRLTRRLFRPGYSDFNGLALPVPWGAAKYRMFSTGRALAAAHVYVHLTLLQATALLTKTKQSQETNDVDISKALAIRYRRANYLIETLSMRHYHHEFGADGLEFIDWLHQGLQLITKIDHVKEILKQCEPENAV